MSTVNRPARLTVLASVVAAVATAMAPAARAVDPAAAEVRRPTGPAPAPAFEAHGSVAVPTSLANGVRCPDAATNGAAAYSVEGVTAGRVFALRADDATYRNDFDVHFYPSLASCVAGELPLPHINHAGDENAVVPDRASVGVVTLKTGSPASFTYTELASDGFRRFGGKPGVTVVAVIETGNDGGYSPYHNDFLGSHHPWNTDADNSNNLDFSVNPAEYVTGFPAASPFQITLPTSDGDLVADLAEKDDSKWKTEMKAYSDIEPNLYWLPGTKVIGMASFGPTSDPTHGRMVGPNTSHATKAAAVAAGNVHGTCAECVFVLLGGDVAKALQWAMEQPWVDVITNSYITQEKATATADVMYVRGNVAATREAVEAGRTIVWGAGNGTANMMAEGPSATYTSSQRGPDWIVTTGAVFSQTDQPYRASGKPADIAAHGDQYPSSGGTTPNGTDEFSGTSNASPVVAGTFARVVQRARELVGDIPAIRRKGEVARGPGRPCFQSPSPCPLEDGVLTREELQDVVFTNVLPSTADLTTQYLEPDLPLLPGGTALKAPGRHDAVNAAFTPPTDFKPAALGHGIVHGRRDASRFVAEQRRFDDALRGAVSPYPRPPGERAWLTADSKCRQRLWGTWGGGYSKPTEAPSFGPDDTVGAAWDAMCSALPQDTMLTLAPLVPHGALL